MRGMITALNSIYKEEEATSLASPGTGTVIHVLRRDFSVGRPGADPGHSAMGHRRQGARRRALCCISLANPDCAGDGVVVGAVPIRPFTTDRAVSSWATTAAAASATIWVAGSLLFSYYASQFNHLNPLLGSLGAFTLFFLWSYLTVLTVLLGAQMNAEMERQVGRE